ncbi:hypothetical protein D3C76_520130 [compost metagenome]
MTWLNSYLLARYKDGGRGPHEWDCWGLARHVRHEHLGKHLLPSFGDLRNTDPKGFTRAYAAEASTMEQCAPEVGAIAAVLHGALCVHVAVIIEVDGRLNALEINPKTGARRLTIPEFEGAYLKVCYYRDRDIPLQA